MPRPSLPHRLKASAAQIWRRHGMLLILLAVLSVAAAASQSFLPAALITGDPVGPRTLLDDASDGAEACTSKGSIFASINDPEGLKKKYRELASAAVEERRRMLGTPEEWDCEAQDVNDMLRPGPALQTIAAGLPAWKEDPVRFSSFSSVMMELQRVYECRLTEMQQDGISIVFYPPGDTIPHTLFESPRMQQLLVDLNEEKAASRIAMERSLMALRSYEIAAPFSVEMTCLQLETADVRIAMSLLSDAMSCLPKIWDITTSLRDRDGE